ncbi:MAG: hypothetical protein ACREO7_15215 [Pseudoxanthomonas sp.]
MNDETARVEFTFHDYLSRGIALIGLASVGTHVALLVYFGRNFPAALIFGEFVGLGAACAACLFWCKYKTRCWSVPPFDERDRFVTGRATGLVAGFGLLCSLVIALVCMVSAIMPQPLAPNLLAWFAWLLFLLNWPVMGIARILMADGT